MGALNFYQYQPGSEATAAFYTAVLDAINEHGNSGYTGTIAEKHELSIIQANPVPQVIADYIAETLIDQADERIYDKWGPAGAIPIGPTEVISTREVHLNNHEVHSRSYVTPGSLLRRSGILKPNEALDTRASDLQHTTRHARYGEPVQNTLSGRIVINELKEPTTTIEWLFFGWASS